MLISTYAPAKQAGNGSATAFNFSFKILAATDLVVQKYDASGNLGGQLLLGTDYTVAFDPIAETGTVTYTVAPLAGGFSLISRVSDPHQQTLLPREGSAPAKITETMIDKVTALLQEIAANQALITISSSAIQVGPDITVQALAAAGVPFFAVLTTTRTVQLWTGVSTYGNAGWVLLGGW